MGRDYGRESRAKILKSYVITIAKNAVESKDIKGLDLTSFVKSLKYSDLINSEYGFTDVTLQLHQYLKGLIKAIVKSEGRARKFLGNFGLREFNSSIRVQNYFYDIVATDDVTPIDYSERVYTCVFQYLNFRNPEYNTEENINSLETALNETQSKIEKIYNSSKKLKK